MGDEDYWVEPPKADNIAAAVVLIGLGLFSAWVILTILWP